MSNLIKYLLLCALSQGALGSARAQSVPDPTRPPAAWLATQPGGAAMTAEQDSGAGLRILVIGKSRKFAVADGQVLRPGDDYDGAKVRAIGPDGLVVQEDTGSRTLKLAPGIEKKAVSRTAQRKGRASASSKAVSVNGETK